MKSKSTVLKGMKVRYPFQEVLEEYEKKYGSCDYEVDDELYPEEDDYISSMNNYWIRKSICYILEDLNSLLKDGQMDKLALKHKLDLILSHEKLPAESSRKLRLLNGLVRNDRQEVWNCLVIPHGVQFAMENADKEHIYGFFTELLSKIRTELEQIMAAGGEINNSSELVTGKISSDKKVSWVEKVGSSEEVVKGRVNDL